MKRYIDERFGVAQAAEMAMTARLQLRHGNREKVPEHETRQTIRDLAVSLAAFDETSADRTLQQLFGAYAPTTVLRDVILPYLADVGERWAGDRLTIAQEHFASQFIQVRLHALSRGWDRGLGPRAVLAAAPGDHHTLGLTCFGIALSRLGWRIVFLGPATPIEVIGDVVAATGAALVVVSTSVAGQLAASAEGLSELAALAPVALGGPAASAELARRCRATRLEDPIDGAAEVALAHDVSAPAGTTLGA
jgi:methanogenic corrinoid protein MtbC1